MIRVVLAAIVNIESQTLVFVIPICTSIWKLSEFEQYKQRNH